MLYWSVVFVILAWGSAILALGPLPGSQAWLARIAALAFAASFIFTVSSTLRTKLKHLGRANHVDRDRDADRQRRVSAGDQR